MSITLYYLTIFYPNVSKMLTQNRSNRHVRIPLSGRCIDLIAKTLSWASTHSKCTTINGFFVEPSSLLKGSVYSRSGRVCTVDALKSISSINVHGYAFMHSFEHKLSSTSQLSLKYVSWTVGCLSKRILALHLKFLTKWLVCKFESSLLKGVMHQTCKSDTLKLLLIESKKSTFCCILLCANFKQRQLLLAHWWVAMHLDPMPCLHLLPFGIAVINHWTCGLLGLMRLFRFH